MGLSLLCPYMRKLSRVSFRRVLVPFFPQDLINSQRPHLLIPLYWDLLSTYTFQENTNIQSIAAYLCILFFFYKTPYTPDPAPAFLTKCLQNYSMSGHTDLPYSFLWLHIIISTCKNLPQFLKLFPQSHIFKSDFVHIGCFSE